MRAEDGALTTLVIEILIGVLVFASQLQVKTEQATCLSGFNVNDVLLSPISPTRSRLYPLYSLALQMVTTCLKPRSPQSLLTPDDGFLLRLLPKLQSRPSDIENCYLDQITCTSRLIELNLKKYFNKINI